MAQLIALGFALVVTGGGLIATGAIKQSKVDEQKALLEQQRQQMAIQQAQEEEEKRSLMKRKAIFDNIVIGDHIGGGAFGDVYSCTYKSKAFALKIITISPSKQHVKYINRELKFMTSINHRNVINAHCWIVEGTNVKILMDKSTQGDLAKFIATNKNTTLNQLYILLLDVAQGMDFLHSLKVVHRDLKCGNVLIMEDDDGFYAKVSDLGLATDESQHSIVGTSGFIADEVFEGGLSSKADVYSYGALIVEIIAEDNPKSRIKSNFGLSFTSTEKKRYGVLCDIAIACCKKLPSDRPNFSQIISYLSKHIQFSKTKI